MSDYAVVNPATGETIKSYPTTTARELDALIGRADVAHAAVGRSSVAERAERVRRIAVLHAERRQELAQIAVREMGKPVEQALFEVDFSVDVYTFYAENAEALLADEPIELPGENATAVMRRRSLGVVLGIMPWNFPYYQVARFAAPNLLLGNTVLLKPAPQCPESSAAIEKIVGDAGPVEDVYFSILATNEQIEQVIADPRVQGVSLTGSERAGAAVAEIAGRNLKKVVLELGGSDPFVVLSTDDLDATVTAAVSGRLANAGQGCNAAKRFVVVDELYDAFLDRFAAALTAVTPEDPTSAETKLGPLSSAAAAERLSDQVERAVAQGATLFAGGSRRDSFYDPAILTDIRSDNDIYREELFGPVAAVYRVADEDEAVAVANATPFGLGSYLFTTDQEQAMRVADRIDAGMVFVNAVGAEAPELPFGGIKRSGFGRELGKWGADEFVNKKMIRLA